MKRMKLVKEMRDCLDVLLAFSIWCPSHQQKVLCFDVIIDGMDSKLLCVIVFRLSWGF